MLKEYQAKNHKGEPRRRWFSNEYFDVYVWQERESAVTKFELCYDKKGRERALAWAEGVGFCHYLIDSGEISPVKNRAPILVADTEIIPIEELLERFTRESSQIQQEIRSFIIEKITKEMKKSDKCNRR
jgi:hypothetical protein